MTQIFAPEFWPLWGLVLALALFLPVRNLIFVLYVRRARRAGIDVDEAQLRRRAGATAALLCFVFSMFYANYVFNVRT